MKLFSSLLIILISLQAFAQGKDSCIDKSWEFTAWVDQIIIPGQEDVFNPTFYAEHKNLHLEGRYNYEDMNTVSFWVGHDFHIAKKETFSMVVIPIAGVVLGRTNGIAPGLETLIKTKRFLIYSEAEYVFDYNEQENDFFYMFSQLGVRMIHDKLHAGEVSQVTRLFETPRDWDHGAFAEYYFGKCRRFRTGLYYFNPFSSGNFWILSASVDF